MYKAYRISGEFAGDVIETLAVIDPDILINRKDYIEVSVLFIDSKRMNTKAIELVITQRGKIPLAHPKSDKETREMTHVSGEELNREYSEITPNLALIV